ncbi:hypothetical protein BVC80_9049g8 [Macleaya cordata]|uniref:Uncharacterized protein n=1 Tax=Macleaya cordata TaxID=56857 RepID=A0A200R2D3_MACCD|nr:hypothetical protein BVC80_9049g8 [Macleaya cordata]
MASFLIEEFVGNGILKELVPKLVEEGWDDIPTLKLMNSEDMVAINMNQQQKVAGVFVVKFVSLLINSLNLKLLDALEIRSYLHDRALLQYGDKLEASGKSLPEILNMNPSILSSDFGMKRGHIARFTDRTSSCAIPIPPTYVLPARKKTALLSMSDSVHGSELGSLNSRKVPTVARTSTRGSRNYNQSLEKSLSDIKIKEGHVFKGIVAAEPAGSGCSTGHAKACVACKACVD